jgi:hypothetical protein
VFFRQRSVQRRGFVTVGLSDVGREYRKVEIEDAGRIGAISVSVVLPIAQRYDTLTVETCSAVAT